MCAAAHRPVLGALAALGLSACHFGAETGVFEPAYGIAETGRETDADDDGYTRGDDSAGGDCDDSDPNVHPGAEETAGDGVDSNCDGEDDT